MDAGFRHHRLQPHRMTAHLRALRDEATADLCSHQIRRENCADHQTEPEETP